MLMVASTNSLPCYLRAWASVQIAVLAGVRFISVCALMLMSRTGDRDR